MARSLRLACGLALLAFLVAGSSALLDVSECPNDLVRLPKRIQPEHYKLDVRVDPNDELFTGNVEIDVKHVTDPGCGGLLSWARTTLPCERTKIIIHAFREMELEQIAYEETGTGGIPLKGVCRSPDNDMLIIELSRAPAPNSSGKLKIDYRTKTREQQEGLTRLLYRDPGTKELKNLLVTHLEPSYQRKLFPGFDEPDFKATFELAVEHPSNTKAVANTRPSREEKLGESTKTYFGRTPKMSSYLLAFAVGQFDYIQTVVDDKMTMGIYTAPGRSDEARKSLEIAAKGYKILHDFFEVDQPIDKIDFVALRNFKFGGMENWGLVTIQETAIFADRYEHDAIEMNFQSAVIIHELAHHWFGNLVTMKWWDNLWLNEGFTNWMEVEMNEQLFPNLGAESIWLLSRRRQALLEDANEKLSHPIKDETLQTEEDFARHFDEITYQKAHSTIRMLDHFVGHDKFKQGLRAYMRKFQFGNADDTDLWHVLAESSGLDVMDMMHSWLNQPGFPLVSAKMSGKGKLEVSQQRFANKGSRQLWVVPISLLVSDGKDKLKKIKFVLKKAKDTIALPSWFDVDQPGHWLKMNADYEGFWYAKYEPKLMAALRGPIETKTMGPIDRLNLIDECLGMFTEGLVEGDQIVELLSWFQNEDDHAVISMLSLALEKLKIKYGDEDDQRGLHTSLINYYNNHGLANDENEWPSVIQQFARSRSLFQLVKAGYEQAITDTIAYYDQVNGKVPGFLKEGVYLAIGTRGTMEQWAGVCEWFGRIEEERFQGLWTRRLLEYTEDDFDKFKIVRKISLSQVKS